jgi:hypothetical protein
VPADRYVHDLGIEQAPFAWLGVVADGDDPQTMLAADRLPEVVDEGDGSRRPRRIDATGNDHHDAHDQVSPIGAPDDR